MKIRIIISTIAQKIRTVSGSPDIEAMVLFCYVFGQQKSWVLQNLNTEIDEKSIHQALSAAIDLRLKNVPLEYITGQKYFYNHLFSIRPGVLIPRPETEMLVDLVITHVAQMRPQKTLHIFEVGYGSGCISISIIKALESNPSILNKFDELVFSGSDISAIAYNQFETNFANIVQNPLSDKAKFQFRFWVGDVFKPSCDITISHHPMDIVVSNPPYIKTSNLNAVGDNVRFEPKLALDGGHSGIEIIQKILHTAISTQVTSQLSLYIEIDYNILDELHDLIAALRHKYLDQNITYKITKDINQLDRVLEIQVQKPY